MDGLHSTGELPISHRIDDQDARSQPVSRNIHEIGHLGGSIREPDRMPGTQPPAALVDPFRRRGRQRAEL